MMNRRGLRWVSGKHTPSKTYITRVFNYGTWQEWKEMKKRFTRNEIIDAVQNPLPGQWTERAKLFAETIFEIKIPSKALISYEA